MQGTIINKENIFVAVSGLLLIHGLYGKQRTIQVEQAHYKTIEGGFVCDRPNEVGVVLTVVYHHRFEDFR